VHSPDARQSTDEVLGDYSCQYETVGESNSRNPEVSIPRAELDAAGEGFTVTCNDGEVLKLIEDSDVMVG
jgi:hypothetical protein